jgi:carboxymethylenebutenolidase
MLMEVIAVRRFARVYLQAPTIVLTAGTNFAWHEFNGAHAFMRDERPRYDAAAARMVYAMSLDLFYRKLSEGDLSQIQGSAETRH